MKPSPALPRLLFACRGRFLVSSGRGHVDVWDFHDDRRVSRHAGELLGLSKDAELLLLHKGALQFEAYHVATGQKQDLGELAADAFPEHVRFFVYGDADPSAQAVNDFLFVVDALGREPVYQLSVGAGDGYRIEQWAVVPNRRVLAVAFWGGPMGYDTAFGRFTAFEGGGGTLSLPMRGFSPNRFMTPPPLAFSMEHDLLLSGGQNNVQICDLNERNATEASVYVYGGGSDIVAVSPKNRSILALSQNLTRSGNKPQLGFRLVDRSRGTMEGTILWATTTKSRVEALLFHPEAFLIAALLADGTLGLWRADTGACCCELGGAFPFSPPPALRDGLDWFNRSPTKKRFSISLASDGIFLHVEDRAKAEAALKSMQGIASFDDFRAGLRIRLAKHYDQNTALESILARVVPTFAQKNAPLDPTPIEPVEPQEKSKSGATVDPISVCWVLTHAEAIEGAPLWGEQGWVGKREAAGGENVLMLSLSTMETTMGIQEMFLDTHPDVIAYGVVRRRPSG